LRIYVELSGIMWFFLLVISSNMQQKTNRFVSHLTKVFVRHSQHVSNAKLKLISKQSKSKVFFVFSN
jgi:hypothetical protein